MDIHSIDFGRLKKNLKNEEGEIRERVKITLFADSPSQFVVQALRGYGLQEGIRYEIQEADYIGIAGQVFDPGSALYRFEPDFVLILRTSEQLLKDFSQCTDDLKNSFAEEQARYTVSLYQALTQSLKTIVLIGNFAELDDRVFGNFANKTSLSFIYQLRKLNYLLMERCREQKTLFVCDICSLAAKRGYRFYSDPKMYFHAGMVYSIDFLPWLAKNLHDTMMAARGRFKKCLVVDLDNLLWGGTIGDEGLEGIQIGELGLGRIFTDIQQWLKELVKRGILLAVCSKNDEETAKSPFLNHPDMKLRLSDISVFVANWENKVDNIHYIQQVLGIGFDTMVFLDDSPFEREMVRQSLPAIVIPSLPEDPSEYLDYLRDLNLFETGSYTGNDAVRTRQYQEESKRTALRNTFGNEKEFLSSLQMVSEVRSFDPFVIPRVAQLSQRSNQFNLRTVRYTETEIQGIASNPLYLNLSFTLQDIYGDYGLIGFVVMLREDNAFFIENWVMSCRVLRREMEKFMLTCMKEAARDAGGKRLIGEYIPTPKNNIVKDHYKNLGFAPAGENRWMLDITDRAIPAAPSGSAIPIKKSTTNGKGSNIAGTN